MKSLRFTAALVLLVVLPLSTQAGWSWKLPPDLVTPDSGKRNHVFYVGEPVTFKCGGAATKFEVRDYYGQVLDAGPAGAVIAPKVSAPGWYKLYLYGDTNRTN